MEATSSRPAWKTLLAFAIIYFVWGSTFLAIRVGVREVPPFLLAAIRFLVAGVVLYAWMRAKGTASPSRREWMSAAVLAVLIFVLDYGLLFWAERRVPSGIAAVMMATIPVFMTLWEIVLLGTQRLTFRLAVALLIRRHRAAQRGRRGLGTRDRRDQSARLHPRGVRGARASRASRGHMSVSLRGRHYLHAGIPAGVAKTQGANPGSRRARLTNAPFTLCRVIHYHTKED